MGRPSRSLPHAPVPIDERFPPDALESRLIQGISSTSYIDFDLHSIDRCNQPHFDWRLYHGRYVALREARVDHIVTAEPIEPHMDYHAPYMTWYCRIARRFITPMDDSYAIETMTSIISRGGHALEDFDSDACRTGIVDIICMTIDVMCIIQEDYCIPYVEHGGGGSTAQSTVAQLPLVQGPYFFRPTISTTPTSSDSPSIQPPTPLDLPPLQPPTSSDPPLVQIDTFTQLDLLPTISRGRRGLR
ncbi:Serine/threonine-protein phosphatase 7 long form-like [Vitis vinifera]|uniref:Serine/threonine-protein phosphatase 7 long form-like n=1 Tax=Vitis vinifera TaxID=29760 RepID=A0A438HTP3_VITVI|nr:Serine/threonine-protein phosphatase 7 long form-like [Vitis vinifera]